MVLRPNQDCPNQDHVPTKTFLNQDYSIRIYTAPETPFVSIPSTSGLSYVENHTNRAMPDVSSIRGRASSIGNDSDTDQADQTQGLDQAQDILNGLDV